VRGGPGIRSLTLVLETGGSVTLTVAGATNRDERAALRPMLLTIVRYVAGEDAPEPPVSTVAAETAP
jgi:hypothetical protein